MIKELILSDGRKLINVPSDPHTLREMGIPQEQADQLVKDAWAEEAKQEAKKRLRQNIHDQAGDALSLIGAQGDVTALLLRELGSFFNQVAKAKTLAQVKEAAKPLATLTQDLNDDITFPYEKKGASEEVIADFKTRSQTITTLLS